MKKKDAFKLGLTLLLALTLGACQTNKGSTPADSQPGDASTSEPAGDDSSGGAGDSTSAAGDSTSAADDSSAGDDSSGGAGDSGSEAPQKSITISAVTMVTENNKVYVKVSGTQANYSAAEFKWAWGLKVNGDNGEFVDGKAQPEAADFQAATFDSNNAFELKYSLSDIENLVSGTFYRVYGGTPESYNDIAFTDQQAGGKDALRSYYLRSDQQYSIVFDARQPVEFTKASVVKITAEDIPADATATQVGAYVKFGGANLRGYTAADIAELKANNKIAGNFQRVIGGYSKHDHADTERFWKIEGDDLFFYCYVGFMADNEGWMVHFDMVNGNSGANLTFENVIWGEQQYVIDGAGYRVYADSSKSGESNYYGCLGIFREHIHNPQLVNTVKNSAGKDVKQNDCSCGEKTVAIDFKDYSTIGGTDGTNPWYMKKGQSVTWNIPVDKEVKGAKLYLGLIATSDDHLGRHLYNEAKYDEAHKDDEGFVAQNTASNPDTTSQDDYRFTISVGDQNYALTNTKTMAENGAKKNEVCYIEVTSIDLAAGDNVLKYTQGATIGYRMKLNGEVRIVYKGAANIGAPKANFQEWVKENLTAAIPNAASLTNKTTYANDIIGYKWNDATNGKATFTYTATETGTATLRLLLSPKKGNQANTGFWKQGNNAKTEIIVGENKLTAPAKDLDFTVCTTESSTGKDGTSVMMEPEWFDIVEVNLTEGESISIQVNALGGSYAYYFCGAALAK